MSKILLRNGNRLGDTILMTSAIRDLKKTYPDYEIHVQTNHPEVWFNNPNVKSYTQVDMNTFNDMNITSFDEVYNIGCKIVVQGSKTNGLHYTTGFRVCLEDRLRKSIRQGFLKPDLYLTKFEKNEKIIEGDYWLICPDYGKHTAKEWYSERWQEVVDKLPWINFVQVGDKSSNKIILKGQNVLNYVGKTNLRELFRLVYHSQGCVSLVSALMHIAGAFDKPCVVIAGAREPNTLEAYIGHRYLHYVGSLSCANPYACWSCSLEKCIERSGQLVNEHPRCMDMIRTEDVVRAIESYYIGEVLGKPNEKIFINSKKKPILKIVSNAKFLGGAERSYIEIAKMALERNYEVKFVSRGICSDAIKQALVGVEITNKITDPCDILFLYASDMVFDFNKPEFDIFNKVQAKRKVMALTYKLGKVLDVNWTRGWDSYLFLSSTMKEQFVSKMDEIHNNLSYYLDDMTLEVLAPPVELKKFYNIKPNYYCERRILRHSSQGDSKYPKDIADIIKKTTNKDIHFIFMPAPSFMPFLDNVVSYPYDKFAVEDFLSDGNCFWYLLPEGYTDQGPRVIMEAMASGLPVIAENRDGAKDRVIPECGWLVDKHEEVIDIINSLTPEILEEKGKKARERAKTEFKKEKWIEAIINGI